VAEAYLFGDGSIALIWDNENLIAGMRFIGNQYVSCYFRLSANGSISQKFMIDDFDKIYEFIKFVNQYI
jgi:hypothetical protein